MKSTVCTSACVSLRRYTPASSSVPKPTSTLGSRGTFKNKSSTAALRSPGPNLAAQPARETSSVNRIGLSVMASSPPFGTPPGRQADPPPRSGEEWGIRQQVFHPLPQGPSRAPVLEVASLGETEGLSFRPTPADPPPASSHRARQSVPAAGWRTCASGRGAGSIRRPSAPAPSDKAPSSRRSASATAAAWNVTRALLVRSWVSTSFPDSRR